MSAGDLQNGSASISLKLIVFLWLAVLGSALGVVYVTHQSRLLYHELALLEQEKNRLEVDWGRYLLEESSLASMHRVEAAAQKELGLAVPGIEEVVVVKP
ncbi:MAG TPA: cell division protein FtsL [Porticoccaceae bacterium]|nr:cell division protein FtsL [Porticoccaceae bacterium]HCO60655.1 cell division protein FtsL [Porticoccaceae bacterium]